MGLTRILAAIAALLLVFGFGPRAAAPSRRGAERGVRQALVRLNGLLAQRDIAIVDEFMPDGEVLLVGYALDEVARGRAGLETHFRRLFALPQVIRFDWREVEVSVHGAVAWLHAEGDLVLQGEPAERRTYRLTGVFELCHGVWKWRLFHGSQPAA
ncbi:nuclear transport factor 2 family protein [Phenylobacterium sp.]|jgi:ketosteroid isomerase-like protein|uniref:nuclear transport factor 2 family protein n=1 Tax=Phenylobacterium sp. TaxID=1871053 RepID=UPI003783F05B